MTKQLTPEQLERTLELLDKEHGFENQPRVVIMHEKDGLAALSRGVVAHRLRKQKLSAIPDSHNYRKHEIVARQLEREFG